MDQWLPEGWTVGDKIVSGGLLTVVVTLGLRQLRMLLSGDSVKLTKDRAEEGLVKDLRREREEAKQEARLAFELRDEAQDRERSALAREAECLRIQERLAGEVRLMSLKMESMTEELRCTTEELGRTRNELEHSRLALEAALEQQQQSKET